MTMIPMKKILLFSVCSFLALFSFGQGKYFGGNGMGYHFETVRDTIACAATAGVLNEVGCDSVVANGQTFTSTGTYFQTLVNADGCDSSLTLLITVHIVDVSVSATSTTITANGTGTYQWLDCDNGMAPIPGATSQSFSPPTTGNYAVAVTLNGCSSTSPCTNIIINALTPAQQLAIEVFPNPSAGEFKVTFEHVQEMTMLTVLDVLGHEVYTQSLLHSSEATVQWQGPAGVYFLQAADAEGKSTRRAIVKE